MTAPRVGETFHLDLDGTAIAGRYIEVDPPHRGHGVATSPSAGKAAEPLFEIHNLTVDAEERHNRVGDAPEALSRVQSILETEREARRLLPSHHNPAASPVVDFVSTSLPAERRQVSVDGVTPRL